MDKSKIIKLMGENKELLITNPYYRKLYDSIRYSEFNEEELVAFIKGNCELIQTNREDLIVYQTRYGDLF